jgi:hypothetical protein
MLYNLRLTEATAASPRVVDAHSLLHLRSSKAARACDAADVVDGLIVLQNPTLRLAAAAFGISAGSVARAHRLSPEERNLVRRGWRPLVQPRMQPVPVAPSPLTSPQEQLSAIVDQLGLDRVLNLLSAFELTNAA